MFFKSLNGLDVSTSRIFTIYLFVLVFFSPILANALPASGTITQLAGEIEFAEADVSRNVIYASIPSANQIAVVSMDTLQVVDSIEFTGSPYGMDLSADNNTLYVALTGSGTVAIVDLSNNNDIVTEIDVKAEITADGSSLVDQVYAVLNFGDLIFASANPGSCCGANVIVIDRSDNDSISRVGLLENGNYLGARDKPHLRVNNAGTELYYGDGSAGLARVDIQDSTYPILFFNSSPSAGEIAVETSDGRLILKDGEEINALNFEFFRRYQGGEFRPNSNEDYIIGIQSFGSTLLSYRVDDPSEKVISIEDVCEISPISNERFNAIVPESTNQGVFLFSQSGNACYFSQDNDGDGRFDLVDNCPLLNNPDQMNSDSDRLGDACDDDDDGDGLLDGDDPFPLSADGDSDGVVDSKDAFPTFFGAAFDSDGDGLPDSFFDTCDLDCQTNSGLIIDSDDDNDLITDLLDDQPLIPSQTNTIFSLNSVRFLDLDGEPGDIAVDESRSLAYVSVPEQKRIYWVSLKDLSIVYSREVSGEPGIMKLSDQGSKLVIGLSDSGNIEFLDLDSPALDSKVVDVSKELRNDPVRRNKLISDIAITGNRVFVIGSEFASRLVELDLQSAEVVFVSDFTQSSETELAIDQNAQVLYMETGPVISAYDLNVQSAPLIGRELLSGNAIKRGLTVSQNGDYLFLGEGRIVATDLSTAGLESFLETIDYETFDSDAVTARSPNPNEQSLLDTSKDILFSFDTKSFTKTGEIQNPCDGLNSNYVPIFKHAQQDKGWLISKEQNGAYKVCFQPRPASFSNGFASAPNSADIADYFLLTDTTSRFYKNPLSSNATIYSQAFASNQTIINGVPNFELVDSRGVSEFFVKNADGVSLSGSVEPAGRIDFDTPLPVLPEQMRQGYLNFVQGEVSLTEGGVTSPAVGFRARILIDDFKTITLTDNINMDAFRVKRELTILPNNSGNPDVIEYFWFAEGFGIVQSENENNFVTSLAYGSPDSDGDGVMNIFDDDDDNDGVIDLNDAFPLDPRESADFDRDGVGDNRDRDDDNDGLPDLYEIANGFNPRNRNDARQDPDGDGRDNLTEYRQETDPLVADEAPSQPLVAPIIQLLLD